MSGKPILFVSVNDRCYASYRFFAARLEEAVKRQGMETAWCYLPEGSGKNEESWDRVLQGVLGKPYLAVVDFNSFLPKLAADGRNLIKLFEAPFYHIVLDHPLYHHAALSADTDLQHVICVDERHADYVRANYPQIGQVWAQTIPGTAGALADTPFQERKNEILFCGTYEEPRQYWDLMNELPDQLKKECRLLAEQMLARPERTMEELLAGMQGNVGASGVYGRRFAARMQADFLADAYVRNLRRKQVVEALIRAGQPLALFGQGWEQIGVQAGGPLSYESYVNQIGSYRFALHCMPGFVCGGHDRIGNAMHNGAVCITDRTQYTRSHYEQGDVKVLGYETGQTDELIAQCEYGLTHTKEAEAIAAAGKRYAEAHETWERFAKKLIGHIVG
ncbi:MAG: glycosyltransferase family 1 protein [Lachnospiraceae bacterium]|nr:glycosyltransferase family 1 protein [Lachnospiraceae bacterium]